MEGDRDTATRYRQRAEEMRIIAEDMQNATSREILLTIADDYERMAQQFDDSAATDRKLSKIYGTRISN